MKKNASPYLRGIWKIDRRYRISHASLSTRQLEAIFRLTSVEAAKKQIPPIAPGDLLWYDIKVIKLPKERAKELLPAEQKLNAIYWASSARRARR